MDIRKQAMRLEERGAAYIPFARTLHEWVTGVEERERMALGQQPMERRR